MGFRTAFTLALTALLFACANGSQRDDQPPGLVEGKLSPCPDTPNCVVSEYPGDAEHFIEPARLEINSATSARIKRTVEQMGGQLHSEQNHYLAFTFTSLIFRFVDDFEVRLDPEAGRLHIRSASRVGYSDFGVNHRRAEAFKANLTAAAAD